MRNVLRFYGVTGLLVATAGCQAAETPAQMQARMDQESAAARQVISASWDKWETFVAAGQADSMTAVFTDNATVMPPNQKAVTGHDNVHALWAGFMGMGKWTLDLRTGTVVANGPVAIERGTYTLTFRPGPSAPPGMLPADTGKYLAHWHQVGGQWKVAEETWNSDLAVPQPAAPARRR